MNHLNNDARSEIITAFNEEYLSERKMLGRQNYLFPIS